MSTNVYRFVLPLVHRFLPTPGPGGLVNTVLSQVIGVDASRCVHVTRQLDVMEVLERDDDFSVRIYDEKMQDTTGAFYLGMNDLARYQPDADVIWSAVRREDAELIRRIAAEEVERAIDRVRHTGSIDVVKDLAEVVPIRFVMRYYGVRSQEPEQLLRLFQGSSKYVFAFWSDPVMRDDAMRAGREARALLDAAVTRRRRDGDFGDSDVMGRLLGMQKSFSDGDAGIARSIAGLSSGNLNPPIGLFAGTIDRILSLPEPEAATARALSQGALSGSTSDSELLRDWFLEAQRFVVYPPFSYRHAERDVTLAAGTDRAKRIPQGCTVVTWQSLASFDPDVFERPFDFVPGRPKWQYLGFGHARHRCLGEHIGQMLLFEMGKALLALPHLRRAPGKAGKIQTSSIQQGKYATSFALEFDRAS